MNMQDTLLAYGEWLDGKGFSAPVPDGEPIQYMTWDDLARDFIEHWDGARLPTCDLDHEANQAEYVDLLFTRAPHPDGEFVDAEDQDGNSVRVGGWIAPSGTDTWWRLRIPINPKEAEDQDPVEAALSSLRGICNGDAYVDADGATSTHSVVNAASAILEYDAKVKTVGFMQNLDLGR